MVLALSWEGSGVLFGLDDAEAPVVSVMGMLEEREAAARVRVEELQVDVDRVLAALATAEAVLERRVIARTELAEALAAGSGAVGEPALPVADPVPVITAVKVPVAGSVVPQCKEGSTTQALAPDYRRIVEMLEAELAGGGDGLSVKEMTARLGLELVPAKIEGVRSKAKRLVERGWLSLSPSGSFMPRASCTPDAVS